MNHLGHPARHHDTADRPSIVLLVTAAVLGWVALSGAERTGWRRGWAAARAAAGRPGRN